MPIEPAADVAQAPEPALTREALLAKAVADQGQGDLDKAAAAFRSLLVANPLDYEVLFHLANTVVLQGDLDQGIELLSEIPPDHPEAGLPALGVSAGWCVKLNRYDDAAQRYRKILELDPSINLVRRTLAHQLNCQGRRHEANILIRELCLSGDIMQDELHALIVESDAMYDAPGSPPAGGNRPYWPIGEMGQARYLFTEKKYREAAELVRPIIESGSAPDSMIAFYGRAAVEAQDDDMMAWWYGHLNDAVKKYPEYWAAIGTQLIAEAEYSGAVRALAEAVRLDPTDLRSTRRMFQGLRSLDEQEKADIWIDRYALLNRILTQSNTIALSTAPASDSFRIIAEDLDTVGRKLESLLWQSVDATKAGNSQQRIAELNTEISQTLATQKSFPKPIQVWCGMNLGDGKLPPFPNRIAQLASDSSPKTTQFAAPQAQDRIDFQDVSMAIGLDHAYHIAKQPLAKGFAIYQSMGGGVAVTDIDLDGCPDLYFAQGDADADDFVARRSDRLYRNIETSGIQRLVDVTFASGVQENSYTLGVTSGDWNQDGFADLAIANIGVNQILINQGDGTYRAAMLDDEADLTLLSTSLAMGDVTGDHLPDLFVLNYLGDPNIAKLPTLDESGDVVDAIAPLSVKPSRDRLYINSEDGHWHSDWVGPDASNACTGLGIVMTDLQADRSGNEVYVANDVRNNQLWAQSDDGILSDVAVASGCAYGSIGSATGAMGIASADLDRSGSIDLHVTNYINEPISLFLNRESLFRDSNVKYHLDLPSVPMVGFGTQAIDFSNDGWPDLVVANGHIEDLERRGNQAFRQPMQLFVNLGERFELATANSADSWSKPRLGRALARLDFNQDGNTDFVVTDLLEPAQLWINQSTSNNHWLSLRLVGVSSERDAIGAKIEVQAGDERWSGWVTTGDGFLCKNEAIVHIGLGRESAISRLTVTWPNGTPQSFMAPPIDHSILIVEGDSEPFAFVR
ncbi:ASPIC and UnbV [Rubripirellula tenax]|uniref:ASPIC and UnbV n=2 Tax=Rubripirellula tenax TaxID=2528015 RepID=A0A5C6F6H2_9BACT|nr:ASPIC and UnbV [Rubripirellula tenax]